MGELVLMRHGESAWNRDKHFTGWADVPLTARGHRQAHRAAAVMRRNNFFPDICFSSCLERAVETAAVVATELGVDKAFVLQDWRLNERHYGQLQGMRPVDAMRSFGAASVRTWQRDFTSVPPGVARDDPRHPCNDPIYSDIPPDELPAAESIHCAQLRAASWYEDNLRPLLQAGRRILIVSHANLIKGLIHRIENLPDEDVRRLAIPVAAPLFYRVDEDLAFSDKRYLEWNFSSLVASLLAPRFAQ